LRVAICALVVAKFRLMLQSLPAERFHLVLRHQSQTRPGYELVVAEGGPKIQRWTPPQNPAPFRLGEMDARGFSKLDPAQPSGVAFSMSMAGGPEHIRMTHRSSMPQFCRALSAHISSSNGVGLDGVYEFTLEFTGTMSAPGMMPAEANDLSAAKEPSDAPNIFAAVEKQLGLKLRKLKSVTVEVLVIYRADKVPTEN